MRQAERVPVLMYHRVGEPDHARDIYCIRPDRFAAHMNSLANAGYTSVTIEDFVAWLWEEKTLPEKSFVLTFDDGFAGVHDYAMPVLRARRWPATVFVVAGRIGAYSDWDVTTDNPMRAHRLMNAEQLGSLCRGGVSLQSHSSMHRDLTTMRKEELEEDLSESRSVIEEISGNAPMFLAYPYGQYNETVRTVAQRVGFSAAFSVQPGFNRTDVERFGIHRLDIFGTDTAGAVLRKIRFGCNDGSVWNLTRYYANRVWRRSR